MKSNEPGKIKCSVFDQGSMREGLRGLLSGFGKNA